MGYSGPFPKDSEELSWDTIGVPPEYTTNINRMRRVCTFSHSQYKNMISQLRPDYVFLNFVNYLSKEEQIAMVNLLPEVTHLCYGPRVEDIIAL